MESSPEAVHYAFEGYFDKEHNQMLLMRNVALFASGRSAHEFNQNWPIEDDAPKEDVKSQFDTPEYKAWYLKMQEKHKI